ncbi:hypothetical protein OG2516_13836 [Oceanicola granulosus HTCC2516]|uniref:Gamma-glutamylcyclotransferase AIG2-like domain-containing protein n=1 Tax=Oceanicola granulosus (strain ATCC BAA-861 / DSM 15982 / KCTC 12143 / HTCC2516) TaxID=314256 RepID=Q2CA72_OCEGH|nr:gamma-glutamylcyclotransferase family protein [Oceanicola granulosus]EAR49573.1 hypothetical protein OG2516_13836 [Oceanicola granulosus HTCC2516]
MTAQFFGYGSLVNLATHSYPGARPARLSGWRRVWRHSTLRPVAFLSVERHAGSEIEGVVAEVPDGDWAALDERERAYVRRDVTDEVTHAGPRAETAVYEVHEGHLAPPDTAHPVLLSYVETVMLGYLHIYGEAGIHRFAASTEGWHAPIMDDRDLPLYPRHQRPSEEERRFIDATIAALGCTLIAPSAL